MSKVYRTWFIPVMLLLFAGAVLALGWIYQVDKVVCNGCTRCIGHCPTGALTMVGADAYIDPELCDGCGLCVPHCIRGAIYEYWYEGIEETAHGVVIVGPNPTRGTVSVSGASPGSTVRIHDAAGRLVTDGEVLHDGTAFLDLTGTASGRYFLLLDDSVAGILTLVRE